MNDKRERLMNRMIRIYGFEHPIVVDFCELCEQYPNSEWNDQCLTILVEAHEAEFQNKKRKEIKDMKPSEIIRRIDDLGRVVIPRDIRRTLGIKEGDALEFFTCNDDAIVIRKYHSEDSEYSELDELKKDLTKQIEKCYNKYIK